MDNRIVKRFLPLVLGLAFVGIVYIVVSALKKAGYHLTYVVTPSIPQGLYLVIPKSSFVRYELVEFLPPSDALALAKRERLVPQSGLIIKYVFALPGDHVCVQREAIWINGRKVGRVHKFYGKHKLLPQTNICRFLKTGQYLLLSNQSERSFDSRYFGIISAEKILGRAIPIFIKESKKKYDNKQK